MAKKTVIGYSDVTALLIAIRQFTKIRIIHGPSFSVFCDPNLLAFTKDAFVKVMDGEEIRYTCPSYSADDKWYLKEGYGPRDLKQCNGWKVYRHGRAVGNIIGGNLETICALAGTAYFPSLEGRILFAEDATGDQVGVFHRSLTQLAHMKVFTMIRGLIVGKFPASSPLANSGLLKVLLDDVIPPDSAYPVLYDVHCSHVDPMMSIPLDAPATLQTTPEPILVI